MHYNEKRSVTRIDDRHQRGDKANNSRNIQYLVKPNIENEYKEQET